MLSFFKQLADLTDNSSSSTFLNRLGLSLGSVRVSTSFTFPLLQNLQSKMPDLI